MDKFKKAQEIIRNRLKIWNDESLLAGLRELLKQQGTISGLLIDRSVSLPCSSTYAKRFGGLANAYTLIGWKPGHSLNSVDARKALKPLRDAFIGEIMVYVAGCGATIRRSNPHGLLTINDEFTTSIRIARCNKQFNRYVWKIHFRRSQRPDISLVVRLQVGNKSIMDYFLFPGTDVPSGRLRLAQHNAVTLDVYRSDSLEPFLDLCRRKVIGGHL